MAIDEIALEVLTFRVHASVFALELSAAERVLRMVAVTPLPGAPEVVLGVINVHGDVVPAVDARVRFGWPRRFDPAGAVVLVRTPRRRLALIVDELLGVTAVDLSTERPLADLVWGGRHVRGVVALHDGLLLIQDLESLLGAGEEEQLDAALAPAPT
jgi:purine-binding chemotaxis protein CheW